MSHTTSITHGTFSFFVHVSVVVDRFGRSLRFATYNLTKKTFLIVSWHIPLFLDGGGGDGYGVMDILLSKFFFNDIPKRVKIIRKRKGKISNYDEDIA